MSDLAREAAAVRFCANRTSCPELAIGNSKVATQTTPAIEQIHQAALAA